MASFSGYTNEQIDDLVTKVHAGVITPTNLPVDLYDLVTARLMSGVFDGFGGAFSDFELNSPFYDLLAEYEVNIQVFSAAKTFQQVKDMSNLVFINGQKTPFVEFRRLTGQDGIFGKYDNWLRTEHRTAVNNAFGGNKWLEASADRETFPLLKYQTTADERVRPEHAKLDDIVKPVNSPFWNTFFPPNGWNCRCIVEQLEADEEPITETTQKGKEHRDSKGNVIENPPKLFAHNPGKTKQIFTGEHPYLNVEKRYRQAKRQNFGLPLKPKRATLPPKNG